MGRSSLLKVIGVTGSMAMGKSTISSFFRECGVPVFDFDSEIHQLYAKGGAAVFVIAELFPDVIEEGAVNRRLLGEKIAQNPELIKQIEQIVHPLLSGREQTFLAEHQAQGASLVVFDHPLLFETQKHKETDYVVVVTARPETQKRRALKRPFMTPQKFEALKARQMSDAEKCSRADQVISTDAPLEDNRQVVHLLVDNLKKRWEIS